ncbi:hypothetical protein CEUSTIGMA_g12065.t1 [Chlamydomonas eustigma]|uniref:Uncharacterized protein n=1 Tax=Chlamydomonas eustigma TaxID=1157962 RepID=A0A250XNH7_9CHLO|nr:hypothetical protein CEUSTIGMA_g12065.t1 [Chlamydomonas eustigma]|eukprot:GAX84644.1 hypothetical protein CEUSTIGMA_g12065.t1 [Chlamydomonas eustigma]
MNQEKKPFEISEHAKVSVRHPKPISGAQLKQSPAPQGQRQSASARKIDNNNSNNSPSLNGNSGQGPNLNGQSNQNPLSDDISSLHTTAHAKPDQKQRPTLVPRLRSSGVHQNGSPNLESGHAAGKEQTNSDIFKSSCSVVGTTALKAVEEALLDKAALSCIERSRDRLYDLVKARAEADSNFLKEVDILHAEATKQHLLREGVVVLSKHFEEAKARVRSLEEELDFLKRKSAEQEAQQARKFSSSLRQLEVQLEQSNAAAEAARKQLLDSQEELQALREQVKDVVDRGKKQVETLSNERREAHREIDQARTSAMAAEGSLARAADEAAHWHREHDRLASMYEHLLGYLNQQQQPGPPMQQQFIQDSQQQQQRLLSPPVGGMMPTHSPATGGSFLAAGPGPVLLPPGHPSGHGQGLASSLMHRDSGGGQQPAPIHQHGLRGAPPPGFMAPPPGFIGAPQQQLTLPSQQGVQPYFQQQQQPQQHQPSLYQQQQEPPSLVFGIDTGEPFEVNTDAFFQHHQQHQQHHQEQQQGRSLQRGANPSFTEGGVSQGVGTGPQTSSYSHQRPPGGDGSGHIISQSGRPLLAAEELVRLILGLLPQDGGPSSLSSPEDQMRLVHALHGSWSSMGYTTLHGSLQDFMRARPEHFITRGDGMFQGRKFVEPVDASLTASSHSQSSMTNATHNADAAAAFARAAAAGSSSGTAGPGGRSSGPDTAKAPISSSSGSNLTLLDLNGSNSILSSADHVITLPSRPASHSKQAISMNLPPGEVLLTPSQLGEHSRAPGSPITSSAVASQPLQQQAGLMGAAGATRLNSSSLRPASGRQVNGGSSKAPGPSRPINTAAASAAPQMDGTSVALPAAAASITGAADLSVAQLHKGTAKGGSTASTDNTKQPEGHQKQQQGSTQQHGRRSGGIGVRRPSEDHVPVPSVPNAGSTMSGGNGGGMQTVVGSSTVVGRSQQQEVMRAGGKTLLPGKQQNKQSGRG